ncbi:MAG TPA: sulfatase-like hydrolase/transferase [Thermoanaerobaculia bacterium]|nr:sulfatase-like hydrolase/transferase [Thermoanaerobaculia bacterium]
MTAAVLVASCGQPAEEALPAFEGAPVILLSIDTLRADRLPMFGYRKVATPALDRLRADSILFSNAYTHVPLTLPAHVSLLTGLLPTEHHVRNNIGYVLDESVPTLPRMLKAKGYATGAAISAYVLRGSTGLAHDFDSYDDGIPSQGVAAIGQLQRAGRATVRIASDWIDAHRARPFFYFLHLFEPHSPYEPEEPFRSRYRDRYDGEIATADAITGEFLEHLRRTGVYDRAIIILLSDHGEALGDHGEPEHGIFLYRETIHVPLLMKLPAGARRGETVETPVALMDVAPTIAALTGMKPPSAMRGRSLLAEEDRTRRLYAESFYPRIHLGWSELRSLVDNRYHYIQAPRAELYDLSRDPREKKNILPEERRVAARMREELARYGSEVTMPGHVDPEEAKKLAALGYLSSPAAAGDGPLPDPKDRIGEIAAMVRATELTRANRWDDAVAAYRKIVEVNPRLSDAWTGLGSALESAGRLEEAAEVYKRAIDIAPQLAGEFGLRRGSVLLKLERLDEAEAHARLAEATNPGAMYVLLARIELARKNFGAAEAQARAAANDPNYRMSGELLLAQTLAQQSRLDEALAIVEKMGEEIGRQGLGPVESYALVRGDILARMERYEEAEAAFRNEIQHFPSNQQTYANLALVYMVLDRPAEAQRVLEEMVRNNPGQRAMLFASRTLDALGDASGAERWRRRAERVQ